MSYYSKVQEDAKDFIEEHLENFKKDDGSWGGKSSDPSFYQWVCYAGQLHEYTESAFYHYDNEKICDQSDNLEEDWGLWEGVTDWRRIREIQAFYTLKGDLWFAIEEILKDEELIPEEEIN